MRQGWTSRAICGLRHLTWEGAGAGAVKPMCDLISSFLWRNMLASSSVMVGEPMRFARLALFVLARMSVRLAKHHVHKLPLYPLSPCRSSPDAASRRLCRVSTLGSTSFSASSGFERSASSVTSTMGSYCTTCRRCESSGDGAGVLVDARREEVAEDGYAY